MKKRLEADLISIAHRVLQIKDRSDVNVLCNEARKLYEKLAILQFVEEHFDGAKPTIGQEEIVEKMKQVFEENNFADTNSIPLENKVIEEKILTETIVDIPILEDPKEELDEIELSPAFESEQKEEESLQEEKQISFIDLLGVDYAETTFVKLNENEVIPPSFDFDIPKKEAIQEEEARLLSEIELDPMDIKSEKVSLNEKVSKGINIDLNDRIAFVKNLFGNSEEDYSRVLNQLITYDSFEEAHDFIEDMVKPDYNNWEGKEDYSQRFMVIIEKKFE